MGRIVAPLLCAIMRCAANREADSGCLAGGCWTRPAANESDFAASDIGALVEPTNMLVETDEYDGLDAEIGWWLGRPCGTLSNEWGWIELFP